MVERRGERGAAVGGAEGWIRSFESGIDLWRSYLVILWIFLRERGFDSIEREKFYEFIYTFATHLARSELMDVPTKYFARLTLFCSCKLKY